MCNGFGMIVSSEIKGYFTAPDGNGDVSHSDILSALGWQEDHNQFTRRFVRVECKDWTIKSFRFDEDDTLPGWAEGNRAEIIAMVGAALDRAAPAWAEYKRIRDAAWAEYERIEAPAWAEFVSALRSVSGYVE